MTIDKNTDNSSPYGREFYDAQMLGSFRSAEVIMPTVMQFVHVGSAVDVGCGIGTWLRALKLCGVREVLGIDGDYVDRNALQIPLECFRPSDLSRPLQVGRRFDMALSLEVAEHLPASCAEGFVEGLTRLAPVVLFSAAIPFQGGTHHQNEQWPDYWAELFQRHGYVAIDCIRSRIWSDPGVEWWYAQNIVVYASQEGLEKNPCLAAARRESQSPMPLRLVHPGKYLSVTSAGLQGSGPRQKLLRISSALRGMISKRLNKPPIPSHAR